MPENATTTPLPFELREDGVIVRNQRGKQTELARYDEATGRLEFESREIADKFRTQILQVVGTIADGTTASDRKIRSMGLKGEAPDEPKGKVPPRPKMNRMLGDNTPEVVEWYFEYKPREAYVRYGVKLDRKGEPVRATVRRKTTDLVDDRNSDDNSLVAQKDGPKSEIKGPVRTETNVEETNNAIIASRATHMTFLKEEIVGYTGDDDADDDAGTHDNGGDE